MLKEKRGRRLAGIMAVCELGYCFEWNRVAFGCAAFALSPSAFSSLCQCS